MTRNKQIAISRRGLLAGGAAFAALPSQSTFSQAAEPLKIGFLTVNTGPLAAGGKQQMEGAAFYLKERGGMIAGRKVELITQDTAGNPALARTKTQELVERYNVPVMIGPLATNEALAIDGYIRDSKVPLITTTSSATVDLKSHAANPWVLHAFGTAPQVTYPLGDYAAKTLGFKRMAIVAEDFTYGHEGAGGFHLAFEAAGGKIVQKLWPPLNAPEYAPYLAQIKRDVDAIYIGFAGSNPLRFLKQFDDYGLKGKIALLGNTTSTDEGILRLMGDEALGTFSAGWYAAGLDTPDNNKFVAGINADYQHDPSFYTAGPYTALLIIEEALKTTGGRTDDAAAFLKAMHDVRLSHGSIGPVRLGRLRNPDPRHLYPQGGAREWKTHQHHPEEVSASEPVLDVRSRTIRDTAAVLAGLPAEQESGVATNLPCVGSRSGRVT
jgi:branched-chain amino acid transport system substrate-binding protein